MLQRLIPSENVRAERKNKKLISSVSLVSGVQVC